MFEDISDFQDFELSLCSASVTNHHEKWIEDHFDRLTDQQFKSRYRLTKKTFLDIIEIVLS